MTKITSTGYGLTRITLGYTVRLAEFQITDPAASETAI